jgi:hypothetical protein
VGSEAEPTMPGRSLSIYGIVHQHSLASCCVQSQPGTPKTDTLLRRVRRYPVCRCFP